MKSPHIHVVHLLFSVVCLLIASAASATFTNNNSYNDNNYNINTKTHVNNNNNNKDSRIHSFDRPFVREFFLDTAKFLSKSSPIQQNTTLLSSNVCVQDLIQWMYNSSVNNQQRLEEDNLLQAFAIGTYKKYLNVEHSKWVYKALQCVTWSGSSSTDVGRHPSIFCYGHSSQPNTAERDTVSVCLPQSCASSHKELMDVWLRVAVTDHSDSEMMVNASTVNCIPSRYDTMWYQQPLPLFDLALFILLLFLPVLASIACRYHHFTSKLGRQLAECFSLTDNFERLCQAPPKSAITCVYGIRALSMTWIVFGHSLNTANYFIQDLDTWRNDLAINFFGQIVTNYALAVDTFFLLSGCLTAYTYFGRIDEENSIWFWLKFYRHRLVRLWPSYAYFIFTMLARYSVTHYYANWPMGDPRIMCRDNWWQQLLLITAFSDSFCLNWLWYVNCDWCFYVISPIFLLTLRKTRLACGVSLIVITVLISAAIRAYFFIEYNYPGTMMAHVMPDNYNPDVVGYYFQLYIRPHTRIGPYVIGILLGFLLRKWCGQLHSSSLKMPEVSGMLNLTAGFMTLGMALSLLATFGLYPMINGWPWYTYNVIYGALNRTVFAIGVSFIIVSCILQPSGWINLLLSWRGFVPLANGSYGCYLYSFLPIMGLHLLQGVPYVWKGHPYHILVLFMPQVVAGFVYGMGIALVIEYPCMNLEKLLPTTSNSVKSTAKHIKPTNIPVGCGDEDSLLKRDQERNVESS